MSDRLNIIKEGNTENNGKKGLSNSKSSSSRTEAEARYERMWLTDPEQFNPETSPMQHLRIERTKAFLDKIKGIKTCVDVGAGYGALSRFLATKSIVVTAVDISNNSLKRLEGINGIVTVHDYVPDTKLPDKSFDLVLSTDLIAHLPKNEYRLFVSELVRLSRDDSIIVVSTPVDIHSDEALNLFASLMETEIVIEEWLFSYHRLYIRTIEVLRKFRLNPIARLLRSSTFFMNICEKISKSIWQHAGISHAIFKGRKKPLMLLPPDSKRPIEHKNKRFVWE
jgi:2-polyprenyl-3-methyl-5-hydroxy-6-metoxy-1,4-benzoquinol methylase